MLGCPQRPPGILLGAGSEAALVGVSSMGGGNKNPWALLSKSSLPGGESPTGAQELPAGSDKRISVSGSMGLPGWGEGMGPGGSQTSSLGSEHLSPEGFVAGSGILGGVAS